MTFSEAFIWQHKSHFYVSKAEIDTSIFGGEVAVHKVLDELLTTDSYTATLKERRLNWAMFDSRHGMRGMIQKN